MFIINVDIVNILMNLKIKKITKIILTSRKLKFFKFYNFNLIL